ncbi:fibronectin type III domain-containing protein [Pyxidicoccus sp. 3LFB2]
MTPHRRSPLWVAVCVTWLGCAGGEPDGSDGLPAVDTGGAVSGDGTWMGEPLSAGCEPGDGGTASNTVLVTNHVRYHTLVGTAQRPWDMSANPPHVLVPDGGTFTRIDGMATDGGYRFAGVPQGTYYLGTGRAYIVTDARQVELGSDHLGRSDTVFTDVSVTPLQLDLSNLAPWVPAWESEALASSLELVSGQVEMMGDVFLYDYPLAGQTTLATSEAESWNASNTFPVFEAAKGDALYVNQLGAVDAGTLPGGDSLTSRTVVRSAQLAPFNFTADGTTPLQLSAVMQPVPTREVSLEWRLPEYTARATQMHPSATLRTPEFRIEAGAHRPEAGSVGLSGTLLQLSLPSGSSYNFTRRLTYGAPFPATWAQVASAWYFLRHEEPIPDGSGRKYVVNFSNLVTTDRLADLVASPLRPRIAPPRGLTIDGLNAYVQRQVGTTSPVIAWQPPDLGNPTGYRVALSRYTDTHGFGMLELQGYFYVPGTTTQVRLPPGTLLPGSIYQVRVLAMDIAGHDLRQRPFGMSGLPQGSASTLSSLFTTP